MQHKAKLHKILLINLLVLLTITQVGGVSAGTNIWTSNGPEGGNIYSLAIDLVTPTTLYAGTDDGKGIFKSVDGGGSWGTANTGLPDGTYLFVRDLAIDPVTPSIIYAGIYGKGVFKSVDSGGKWNVVNIGLENTRVTSLVIDPSTPSIIYAGWGYGDTFFGDDGGVFKSTNGGENWIAANAGLPQTWVNALAIDPGTPTTLYAGTDGGISKSTNGGETWNTVVSTNYTYYFSTLVIDPVMTTTLYAGTSSGMIFKSTDGGENWGELIPGRIGGSVRILVIDPETPSTLYAGRGEGVFKSIDGGENWSALNTGLPADTRVRDMAVDPVTPVNLYAGTGGNGVFSMQQTPVLAINYPKGAPGSYFLLTGSQFPPDDIVTVTINKNMLGTIPADLSGNLVFWLKTYPTTDEGFYSITTSVYPGTTIHFTLDMAYDTHPSNGSGIIFDVPDGIAYQVLYLPLVKK